MINGRLLVCILCLLCISVRLQATVWQTKTFGDWENSNTWKGNQTPLFSSQDTFIIDHPIIISHDLLFASNAYLLINAGGGICGHHNVTVNSGVGVLKYGILELDTLFIPGGKVICRGPGDVILTCAGILTNNGSMDVNGCSLAVGPWFSCRLPEYSFAATGVTGYAGVKESYTLSPNPGTTQLVLNGKATDNNTYLEFTDQFGRPVCKYLITANNLSQHQVLVNFSTGMYIWRLVNVAMVLQQGKICIIR